MQQWLKFLGSFEKIVLHLANPLNAEQPMKYFQVIPQNTCKIVTQQFK